MASQVGGSHRQRLCPHSPPPPPRLLRSPAFPTTAQWPPCEPACPGWAPLPPGCLLGPPPRAQPGRPSGSSCHAGWTAGPPPPLSPRPGGQRAVRHPEPEQGTPARSQAALGPQPPGSPQTHRPLQTGSGAALTALGATPGHPLLPHSRETPSCLVQTTGCPWPGPSQQNLIHLVLPQGFCPVLPPRGRARPPPGALGTVTQTDPPQTRRTTLP